MFSVLVSAAKAAPSHTRRTARPAPAHLGPHRRRVRGASPHPPRAARVTGPGLGVGAGCGDPAHPQVLLWLGRAEPQLPRLTRGTGARLGG